MLRSKNSSKTKGSDVIFSKYCVFKCSKHLIEAGPIERLQCLLRPNYFRTIIATQTNRVHNLLMTEHNVSLTQRYIQLQSSQDQSLSSSLAELDRQASRFHSDNRYVHPANTALLAKFINARQPAAIFHAHPHFVRFLHESKILSQLKVTQDVLRINQGHPQILVEGQWTNAAEVMRRFHFEYSDAFDDVFVLDAENEVYTYLDNGLGLQKYHPHLDIGQVPISRLTNDQLSLVQQKAAAFQRIGDVDKPFVLQVITSRTDRGNSNLSKTLRNPRHAYMRLIAGDNLPNRGISKGDVYEFGFGWTRPSNLPLESIQGKFRSPDPWEYMPSTERYVTNLPITAQEAENVVSYIRKAHNSNINIGRKIGFQIAQQNCTVFVRRAVEKAGIAIPTEIKLHDVIYAISPHILRNLGSFIKKFYFSTRDRLHQAIDDYSPGPIARKTLAFLRQIEITAHRALEACIAFGLAPMRLALGGGAGHGGDNLISEERIQPQGKRLKNLFSLKSYRYNLPFILQQWQLQQASTEIYHNPLQLTIVPQANNEEACC